MPIDPGRAVGASLPEQDVEWSTSDVVLYHLALGAGAPPTLPRELRYATEQQPHVLPTFAVVAPGLRETEPPRVSYPGIDIDLAKVLHGSQRVEVHRSVPADGKGRVGVRVTDVWDKGSAAVVVTETEVRDLDGTPLWTATSSIFARGEGGFGGERGPSGTVAPPDREPDVVVLTATLAQQALWYRLLGDRNPLHSDPAFAAAAGFPKPILHGLATYGIACKAIVDEVLGGDPTQVRAFGARFAGVVFPGETLRTSTWRHQGGIVFRTTVADREDAPALSDGELVTA